MMKMLLLVISCCLISACHALPTAESEKTACERKPIPGNRF